METLEQLEARDDVREMIAQLRARADLGTCKLVPIDTPLGVVVVKPPSRGQAAIAFTQMFDDDPGVKSKAMTGLFQMCIVHPAPAELAKLLDEFPFALTNAHAMGEFHIVTGNRRRDSAK